MTNDLTLRVPQPTQKALTTLASTVHMDRDTLASAILIAALNKPTGSLRSVLSTTPTK